MIGLMEELAEYESISSWDQDNVSVAGAIMKMDFGPFKKGDKIDCLSLFDCSGKGLFLREYDQEGEIKHDIKVKIVLDEPIEACIACNGRLHWITEDQYVSCLACPEGRAKYEADEKARKQ